MSIEPLKLYRHARRTVVVYSLKFDPSGWALVYVDNAAGNVSLNCDWGDWAYRWNIDSLGDHKTLESFILNTNNDYLTRKLLGRREHEDWDPEATKKNMERMIKEHAEDIGETEAWIDRLVEDLEWLEWDSGPDVFIHEGGTKELEEVLDPFYEAMEYKPDKDLVFLKQQFFPAFKKVLREYTFPNITEEDGEEDGEEDDETQS